MSTVEPNEQRLTFVQLAGTDGHGNQLAQYICVCGVRRTTRKRDVDTNRVRSCGCLSREVSREVCLDRNTTHGEAGHRSPEYEAWKRMNSRCYNTKDRKYLDYGGRGITVCDEWRNSYPAFLAAVGRKPTPKHSLGRENNNGNYEPGNVSWETATQQARNTRRNVLLTLDNKTQTQSAWAEELGVHDSTLHVRLKELSVDEALQKPVRVIRRRSS